LPGKKPVLIINENLGDLDKKIASLQTIINKNRTAMSNKSEYEFPEFEVRVVNTFPQNKEAAIREALGL
jgi:hypothetical protein